MPPSLGDAKKNRNKHIFEKYLKTLLAMGLTLCL